MSRHLVKAGHSVIGFNRSPGPMEQLVADSGKGAGSVAEAVSEAEVIITMVPDSPDVEAIALGDGGIYDNAPQGSIHIDMSSIRPDVAARLADAGQAAGIRVMDAPVSGGETGAIEGTLSIMVGADAADFDEMKPILEAMGTKVVLVGPPGSGQTVKAANQLIVAGTLELVAEACHDHRRHRCGQPTAWLARCRRGVRPAKRRQSAAGGGARGPTAALVSAGLGRDRTR
jgi:2-hydroxy-3-oxopropionate reductase